MPRSRKAIRRPALPRRRPAPALRVSRKQMIAYARSVFTVEANAVLAVGARLGEVFAQAVELLLACDGHVVVTGIGKPGFIAQKLSSTLASTGVPSLYLHPAEALHGDLGRVAPGDVVLALSNSGASEELVRLLPAFRRLGVKLVAITGDAKSPLALAAELVLDIGVIAEACPLGLVPTASSAAMHAIGDALAMTLLKCRPFGHAEYARFHPGGQLGRAVLQVGEVMRKGVMNPLVRDTATVSDAIAVMTQTQGRPGATNVVDPRGRLVGIFTDGDLRRLVQAGTCRFDVSVRTVMGRHPRCISPEQRVQEALTLMREAQVDQVPVVDADGLCVGLLDVQDVLSARLI